MISGGGRRTLGDGLSAIGSGVWGLGSREWAIDHGHWAADYHSQTAGMIDEGPRHLELFREMRRQRLYAERLRGVMTSVEDIHSQLLRQRKRPVRALARDERIHAFARRLFQLAAR